MSDMTADGNGYQGQHDPHPTVIHNTVSIGGSRGWSILVTLLISAGLTVLAYRLSLSGLKDLAATGISIFLVTLTGYMFKAGILRLPQQAGDDDLAFTKSTLRRIYDEIQTSIVNSKMLKLVLFALAYTVAFMLLRTGVGVLIGMLSTLWVAVGVGLILGGLIVAQDQILAWIRRSMIKKEK